MIGNDIATIDAVVFRRCSIALVPVLLYLVIPFLPSHRFFITLYDIDGETTDEGTLYEMVFVTGIACSHHEHTT